MPDNYRKPVAAFGEPQGMNVVVCDDGSVWREAFHRGLGWNEMPPIPGTKRAEELAREAQRGAA